MLNVTVRDYPPDGLQRSRLPVASRNGEQPLWLACWVWLYPQKL